MKDPRAMKTTLQNRRQQSGGFLLEALIGILIFAFGVLGIVGLQAQSLRVTNESEYRAEAAYLANMLMSEMWTVDYKTLKATYDSKLGTGAGYTKFKADVLAKLQNAWYDDPDVEFDDTKTPSANSSYLTIRVRFRIPGETKEHVYVTSGVVGQNL
jgi:type IV pilus assembly protein PilV